MKEGLLHSVLRKRYQRSRSAADMTRDILADKLEKLSEMLAALNSNE